MTLSLPSPAPAPRRNPVRTKRLRPSTEQRPPPRSSHSQPSSADDEHTAMSPLRVQLVDPTTADDPNDSDSSCTELPYVDFIVDGSERRYYIGRPGQQFAVCALYPDLASTRGGPGRCSKWAVTCDIDGRWVGYDYLLGRYQRGRQLPPFDESYFRTVMSEQNGAHYNMAFAQTTLSEVDSEHVQQETAEQEAADDKVHSSHGTVRVYISERVDLPGKNASLDSSLAPTDLTDAGLSAVRLPSGAKFYRAPGLAHSALLSSEPELDHINYKAKFGAVVADASIYYDTAERLALRSILPQSHPLFPPEQVVAQSGLPGPSSRQRAVVSEELSRVRALLEDAAVRAALPPTLRSAVDFCFSTDEVHTCDLTEEAEGEVWQSSKRVKQEAQVSADV